jgi:hypothetical protein
MPLFRFPVGTLPSEKDSSGDSNVTNSTSLALNFRQVCGVPLLDYILIALNIAIVFVGAFNNCLVALIVWRTRRMQNPTNLLLSNNAIAEIVFLLTSGSFLVIIVLLRTGVFSFSQILPVVKASGFISVVVVASYIVASVNLALLAIERFNALCNPMKIRRRLSKRSTKLCVLTMWFVAIILVSPLHVGQALSKFGYIRDVPKENLIYYDCILCVTIPTVAGCIIIYCYGSIIYGIYISKCIFNSTCSAATSEDFWAKRNIVKLLLSIAFTFVFAKFPAAAYTALIFIKEPPTYCSASFVLTLAHLSAFLNPIIYFVFNSNYSKEAKRLLKICSRNTVAVQDESKTSSSLDT